MVATLHHLKVKYSVNHILQDQFFLLSSTDTSDAIFVRFESSFRGFRDCCSLSTTSKFQYIPTYGRYRKISLSSPTIFDSKIYFRKLQQQVITPYQVAQSQRNFTKILYILSIRDSQSFTIIGHLSPELQLVDLLFRDIPTRLKFVENFDLKSITW